MTQSLFFFAFIWFFSMCALNMCKASGAHLPAFSDDYQDDTSLIANVAATHRKRSAILRLRESRKNIVANFESKAQQQQQPSQLPDRYHPYLRFGK